MEKGKKKKEAVKEEMEERALKECTFAPKTLRQTEKRSLEEFLRDQQRHLDRKQETISKMAKDNEIKEESLMISQPAINERSKILLESKEDQSKPAYERLYEKSKKPMEKTEKPVEQPAKNVEKKKEGERREFALYEEAKKRQERSEARIKEANKKPTKSKNYSRDHHVQQKYIKEFNNALGSTIPENLDYEKMSIIIGF